MRCHLANAKKTIVATAILHNLCVKWRDDMAENEEDPLEANLGFDNEEVADDAAVGANRPVDHQYRIVADYADEATIRQRGHILRDRLCEEMPDRRRREDLA
jgi:hypothetical protein